MIARSNSASATARPRPRNANVNSGSNPDNAAAKRQQAQTAALEAYQRAQPNHEPSLQDYRPAPPLLQRRRSRASGRTEGGHLEDARLGRRKSGSNKNRSEGVVVGVTRTSPQWSSEVGSTTVVGCRDGETVITRRRSVIPPGSSYAAPDSSSSAVASNQRDTRLSRSEYTNGSPVPRHSNTHQDIRRGPRTEPSTAPVRITQNHSDPPSSFSNFDITEPTVQSESTPQKSQYEDATKKVLIAQARDRYLQNFQQKKVRERKSTIFASLSKLRSGDSQKSRADGFDNWLPSFNSVGDGIPIPDVPALPPAPRLPVYTIPVHETKSRNFTDSLKCRIKKVFGKSSRVVTSLPAQHVEGKTFQFSANIPSSGFTLVPAEEEDPFSAANKPLDRLDARAGSAASKQPADITAKSRVTSWTNYTAAGTWSTRSEAHVDDSVDEQGRLKRSDSVPTLWKAKSFFGRPIQNKLRKSSRAQLRSSDESSGLYSALQERIHPSESASQRTNIEDTLISRTSSALPSLPSQQQRESLARRSNGRLTASTIRTVTPDPNSYTLNVPSPVAEVLSPDVVHPISSDPKNTMDSPRSQLQRRPAMKAPTPSRDLVARRMERSQRRWQGPLDEMSPAVLPKTLRGENNDNPYELRSLSRSMQQAPAANDSIPHHSRVAGGVPQFFSRAEEVMSPSVYSHATDEQSPRPDTPAQLGGTMVTITGREVRSYSISPRKYEQAIGKPIHSSNEWRRWLSDEWKGWSTQTQPDNTLLPNALLYNPAPAPIEPPFAATQQCASEVYTSRPDSSSPPLVVQSLDKQPKRPRPCSSRSSFMNERYPLVGFGRNSTDARKVSSRGSSRPVSAEPGAQIASALNNSGSRPSTTDSARPTSVMHNRRVVSKYQSMVGLHKLVDAVHLPASYHAQEQQIEPSAVHQTLGTGPSNRQTKSVFDLRANYKNKATGKYCALAINRSNSIPPPSSSPLQILEDTTIQNIAAGPYASSHHPSSSPQLHTLRKENTPPPLPPSETNKLPTVSSSEWLATGGAKRERPVLGEKRVSRHPSVQRGMTAVPIVERGSPGQRLVTGWLEGKRSKENTPAFV